MKKLFPLSLFVLLAFSLAAQNLNNTLRAHLTFPGQTLANIWGYAADGREYALLGARNGLIIIDVTNPDAPQQIVQIPGPSNLWKEIKTYSHYAYVVSEGGQGVQIVDLANLPSANLPYHSYYGDGPIAASLNRAHALHIDTTRGFLYAYGGNLFSGGPVVLDLKADPYNPVYAGAFTQLGYVHDGYVDNDTLYAGHIYQGLFSIVDMSDKSSPQVLGTQTTPNLFTHNTWPSADKKTLFTTDEKNNSFLAAYDISDPDDIKLLDQIQSNPGSNSIVHNTHIINGFAVTSWYKDGFTIVDVSRPDNLVQTGNYDTYAPSGGGFDGCWGVYPFLPSGTIIASNINAPGTSDGELFVVTPNYVRACWLEGLVSDAATGNPLFGAQVTVQGSSPLTQGSSAANGQYKIGQVQAGSFTVQVTLSGYQPFVTPVSFENGEAVLLDVALFPLGNIRIDGQVRQFGSLEPVPGATVWLYGSNTSYSAVTDPSGLFSIEDVTPAYYEVVATEPDLGMTILSHRALAADEYLSLDLYPDHRRGEGRPRPGHPAVAVAPNPFGHSGRLFYHSAKTGDKLFIYNTLGSLVETIRLNEADEEIVVGENWSDGVYFIFTEKNEVLKVVKWRGR